MSGSDKNDNETDVTPQRARRRIVLVVGGLLVLMVGSGLAFYLGIGPFGGKAALKMHRTAPVVASEPIYVETPEMLTNLDAGPHRIAFAKIQCRIEVDRASDAALVTSSMPRVVDMAETYLRAVKPEELRSDTGAYLLREALLNRIAVAVPGAAVSDVLFEELLVQ